MELSCRSCGAQLQQTFVDLGVSPLANSYLEPDQLSRMEPFYPLHAYVCGQCFLVQVGEFQSPEAIFGDYAYFASYSDSWLAHARLYAGRMRERLSLGTTSQVVEIASNDGYLLQYFKEHDIPVLGVEPASNVAAVAIEKGIPTEIAFFGETTARALAARGFSADLLLGNNVLAHVPALNDFVEGMRIMLKPSGTLTMEFPHLLRLMEGSQFDTMYHEHFSYLSMIAVESLFARHDLVIFDVEELPTHGGSLRIYARHAADTARPVTDAVARLKDVERANGLATPAAYASFTEQVKTVKRGLLQFLIQAKQEGKTVVGYGAPAKGNTLLNYCGVGTDFVDYTTDRSPHKQGRFLPGTRIPIFAPERIRETRPDYLLILPWNLKDEICEQMSYVREWGGRFVVPIPTLEVLA